MNIKLALVAAGAALLLATAATAQGYDPYDRVSSPGYERRDADDDRPRYDRRPPDDERRAPPRYDRRDDPDDRPAPRYRRPPPPDDDDRPRVACIITPPSPFPRRRCQTAQDRPGTPCRCGNIPFLGRRERIE